MSKWTKKLEKCHWFWYCCHGAMLTDCCYSIRIPSISIYSILTDTENKNLKKKTIFFVPIFFSESRSNAFRNDNLCTWREAAELTSPIISDCASVYFLCLFVKALTVFIIHTPHNIPLDTDNAQVLKLFIQIFGQTNIEAESSKEFLWRHDITMLCNCWIWKWSKRVHKVSKLKSRW